MKKIYIHIGTPRTDNHYLRRFLKHNEGKLLDNDIYYPCTLGKKYFPFSEQHVSLIPSILGIKIDWLPSEFDFPNGEALDDLIKDIEESNRNNIVLSSEVFYDVFTNKALMRYLQRSFSEFDIKIIVYVKSQDQYLISYFSRRLQRRSIYRL
jgi:hypothetical protein